MRRRTNVLDDIHPQNFLSRKGTSDIVVQDYNNKFEFIGRMKAVSKGKYQDGIKQFLKETRTGVKVNQAEVEKVKNEVRNNLIKRGIITGTIYEGFKYDVEGEILDHAELASGNPACMLKPIKKYDKWFYELYVNMSIPYSVDEREINKGAMKLIETIKLLEELNVEIKINIILYSKGMYRNGKDFLFILPLASHTEYKDYDLILPYTSGNFLRNCLFQEMHDSGDCNSSLGHATKLENSINLWELKETELAQRVINDLDLNNRR